MRGRSSRRWWIMGALPVLLAACAGSTDPAPSGSAQDSVLAEPVELDLAYGQEQTVPGTTLSLRFDRAVQDSRCPVDVVCVWQGNAEIELGTTLGSGPSVGFRLNTALDPRSFDFGGYRVSLTGVSPEPHAGVAIEPDVYRVSLRVESI